jgi:hypothetical protein
MNTWIFVSLILCGVVSAQSTGDVEWINSKYHDYGAHWGVFAGIITFIAVVELLGLGVETWYKKNLNNFLENENLQGEVE